MVYGQIGRKQKCINGCALLEGQAAGTDLPFAVIHVASGRWQEQHRYMDINPAHKEPWRSAEPGNGLEIQHTVVNTECKYLLLPLCF